MPNQEFPMAQYLQAYQNKYANDAAAKPDLGVALAGGITAGSNAGVNMWAQEKAKRQESTFNAAKDYFSKGQFYIKGTDNPLPPEQVSQFYEMLYDKKIKMKANEDGTASFMTDKDVPFNIDWKKEQMPIYEKDPVTGDYVPKAIVPKGSKVVTPKTDKILINIDAEGRLFDANMKPITDTAKIDWANVTKNSLPNTITPSASEKDKNKLAQGGLDSVNDIKTVIKPDVFGDLKIAMLDPTGVYKQSMSGDSQKAYAGLRNAVGNILYIKTGAAATPKEIDEQLAKYSPTAAQSMEDWNKNSLSLLERDLKYYQTKGGKSNPSATPEQKSTIPTYASEADVLKNPPAVGTKILIGGREAIWQ